MCHWKEAHGPPHAAPSLAAHTPLAHSETAPSLWIVPVQGTKPLKDWAGVARITQAMFILVSSPPSPFFICFH